ncbi:chemotaxis protein CheX [Candidatus Magnetaquicoccus inordinatus]|uniref:chemotaxis protein CheX n=1 Tax=Candidatus Magnetaquicoccus inordinatus TaxID=2496818 RepID=UPI00102AE4C8|nr:chemotaxis protein CheX [Candidatus Magnetaquicoccus inordinatus]
MSKLDLSDLADIIIHSVSDTALTFFTTDVGIQAGPVVVKPEDQPYKPPQADITAVVGFSGYLQGGVHLSAPFHAAIGLASAFSGETIDKLDDVACDALGELTNIIAGSVKERVNDAVFLTPPQVVTGENHNVSYTKILESTKCYFRTDNGPFFVEVFYVNREV